MKTALKRRLWAKTVAFLLVLVLTFGGILAGGSAVCALLFADAAGGEQAAAKRVAEDILVGYGADIAQRYELFGTSGLHDYATPGITYTLIDETGEMMVQTYDGGDYFASASYWTTYYNWSTLQDEELRIMLYADEGLSGDGWFVVRAVETGYRLRWWLLAAGSVSLLGALALVVFLLAAAGWRPGEERPVCNPLDRVPLDVYMALYGVVGIGVVGLADMLSGVNDWLPWLVLLVCAVPLLLAFLMSFATRIKTRTLWRNTVVWRAVCLLARAVRAVCRALPLMWKTAVVLGVLTVLDFAFLLYGEMDNALVFWMLSRAVLLPATVLFVLGLRRLQNGARRLAAGMPQAGIDTARLIGEVRRTAEDLNHIGDGLSAAVEARLKSERFKTELITNVSHDIKTPLTSIINYVDLLSKELTDDDAAQTYLAVLQRQSARLKKLTEDLVEASKASTGNLSVTLEACRLDVLLEQVAGEYTARAQAAALELKVSAAPSLTVCADGRHMWRVFDNLMNNICHYAQPHTRVYLDATASAGVAQITFRNISREELHISAEELMERFVRGDSARSTEGSGLGLSIARSLTELQGGSMLLTLDGDLFKVTLTFPLMREGGEVV